LLKGGMVVTVKQTKKRKRVVGLIIKVDSAWEWGMEDLNFGLV
jgi:hypothetical protein